MVLLGVAQLQQPDAQRRNLRHLLPRALLPMSEEPIDKVQHHQKQRQQRPVKEEQQRLGKEEPE